MVIGSFFMTLFATKQASHSTSGHPVKWMPTYVGANRDLAARNAEEAIVEFLLLCEMLQLSCS